MQASSGDVVAYTRVTAQTQYKPHQLMLWLTSLLLPRHNVNVISLTLWLTPFKRVSKSIIEMG